MTFPVRLLPIAIVLAVLNIGGWVWAFAAFDGDPALLGTALLVYGLGLRHAVDADHIAAIDNVTRKLMQQGQRPVSVGFFFAAGHSALVIAVTALVAVAAGTLGAIEGLREVGGTISTGVSAVFLLSIAAMNIVVFRSVHKAYRRVRAGGAFVEEDLDALLAGRGLLARVFRPLFAMVGRSWHMVPLGILFGLGFDTATEIAVFGLSAAQVAKGLPIEAILVFPVLFAAGMSLVDSLDGVLMLGVYEWAFVRPIRKLHYNMTITLASAVVAAFVGGVEALGLVGETFALQGGFWDAVAALDGNADVLGFAIVGVFAAAWALSYALYRVRELDRLEPAPRTWS